jgi:hypothetical protein
MGGDNLCPYKCLGLEFKKDFNGYITTVANSF